MAEGIQCSGQADSGSKARQTYVQVPDLPHAASVTLGKCGLWSESQFTNLENGDSSVSSLGAVVDSVK